MEIQQFSSNLKNSNKKNIFSQKWHHHLHLQSVAWRFHLRSLQIILPSKPKTVSGDNLSY